MKPRKAPAVSRLLRDIGPEDLRIRVVGRIKSIKNNRAILEDGTDEMTLLFDNPTNLQPGKQVRVFGRPDKNALVVELVQDMDKLDIDVYNKVKALEV